MPMLSRYCEVRELGGYEWKINVIIRAGNFSEYGLVYWWV